MVITCGNVHACMCLSSDRVKNKLPPKKFSWEENVADLTEIAEPPKLQRLPEICVTLEELWKI